MEKTRKPVGYAPREINGLVVRKSSEIPEGVQALYAKGKLLGVFRIGEPVPIVHADAITLHPLDYEVVLKTYLEQDQRRRRRELRRSLTKMPTQSDIDRVLRQKRDIQG